MMKNEFLFRDIRAAQEICAALEQNHAVQAISMLRILRDEMYASIPEKQRIGRGITWVVRRIAHLFASICGNGLELSNIGSNLAAALAPDDILLGVPIFVMGEYGKNHPQEIYNFFIRMAGSSNWIIREFAQGGFRSAISPNRKIVLPWLKTMARDKNANLRRFAAETLRPVTDNRWMCKEPEYSLGVLRLMFRERHPYPRTSVGNNLSDLSRRQPELIYAIAKELIAIQDDNSTWIATRACRNLVKTDPRRVMDVLGVDEYHYKDRNYYAGQSHKEKP